MNTEIIDKIKELKLAYDKQGFVILGIFGSYARGEETIKSDIDILYETNNVFNDAFKGLAYFGKIYEIKDELEKKLNKTVDIADKNALSIIGKKYILPEVLYVN